MKSRRLLAAIILVVCATACQPRLFAQTTVEHDCIGRVDVKKDNATIIIRGQCDGIAIPGNGNTVTFDNARNLSITGNKNTVTQSGRGNGSETELWIAGNDNVATINQIVEISLAGDDNQIRHFSGRDVKTILMGDDNEVVAADGPYPDSASSDDRNTHSAEQAKEARNESSTASTNSQAGAPRSTDAQKSPDAANVVDVLYLGDLNNYDILVLYKDNTARFNTGVPIDYLNVEADKAKSAKYWRQWRREGDRIQVRGLSSNGKWFNLRDSSPTSLKPTKKNLRLTGKWSHFWTSADYTATGGSDYWFTKEGRYKSSSSSLMGASVPGISSTISASSCNSSGSSTVSNSTAAAGSTSISKKSKGCGAANVGEYEIDGYGITFNAEDGKVYRRTFYRLDKDTILIRGKWYAQFK